MIRTMKNILSWEDVLLESKQETLNYFLLQSAEKLDYEKCVDLLELGADPNAQKVEDKYTPLMNLCWGKITDETIKIAEELIKHGADVNMSDYIGRTALWISAGAASRLRMTLFLLENGADPNINTDKSQTLNSYPIQNAEGKNTIKALIIAGADPFDRFSSFREMMDYFGGSMKWAPPEVRRRLDRSKGASKLLKESKEFFRMMKEDLGYMENPAYIVYSEDGDLHCVTKDREEAEREFGHFAWKEVEKIYLDEGGIKEFDEIEQEAIDMKEVDLSDPEVAHELFDMTKIDKSAKIAIDLIDLGADPLSYFSSTDELEEFLRSKNVPESEINRMKRNMRSLDLFGE